MLQFKVTSISVHRREMGCGEWDRHSPGWALSAEPFVLPVGTLGPEGGGGLEPRHCGQRPLRQQLLASRRGRSHHSWVQPGPALPALRVWEGRFREESLARQVGVPSCGLASRPPAVWPARAPPEEGVENRRRAGRGRRGGGGGRRETEGSPRQASLGHWPRLPSGQLAGRAHGRPAPGSGLPCSLRAALLVAPPALAR